MKLLLAVLLLASGCTLNTRPLTTAEQAVVTDMAADAGWTEPIRWRAYTNNHWNHAPAWLRDTIILASDTVFDAANNVTQWNVFHEVGHLNQARRKGLLWPCEYTFNSRRYEAEANEFAREHMEKR